MEILRFFEFIFIIFFFAHLYTNYCKHQCKNFVLYYPIIWSSISSLNFFIYPLLLLFVKVICLTAEAYFLTLSYFLSFLFKCFCKMAEYCENFWDAARLSLPKGRNQRFAKETPTILPQEICPISRTQIIFHSIIQGVYHNRVMMLKNW